MAYYSFLFHEVVKYVKIYVVAGSFFADLLKTKGCLPSYDRIMEVSVSGDTDNTVLFFIILFLFIPYSIC